MRVRERRINNCTQCANQIRGLLSEHGVVIPKGLHHLKRLPIESIPNAIRPLISELLIEFKTSDQWVKHSHSTVQSTVNAHPLGQSLLTLPGFGVMNTLASLIINPSDYMVFSRSFPGSFPGHP